VQIYAATEKDDKGVNWIRGYKVESVTRYTEELMAYMDSKRPDVGKLILEKKAIDDGVRKAIDSMLAEFRNIFRE
jgi:F0F1-type ATP synthase alpha subunit